ncbi:hypothetical protein O9G_000281 [Rozella allomycis CSF55]|uniref:Uncharacterized protein n=1 Tax=Rozella allomycis (strain CSF55) TaxID=988480 RepID=A0A075ATE2_ROZAC|nr:hypothetical protein O9G_000281 [Rozella allomycis CSF55]|eukprot:EPZ31802.1 hypothetical protein O9G_000281 [Rozella allomycis CSF55]
MKSILFLSALSATAIAESFQVNYANYGYTHNNGKYGLNGGRYVGNHAKWKSVLKNDFKSDKYEKEDYESTSNFDSIGSARYDSDVPYYQSKSSNYLDYSDEFTAQKSYIEDRKDQYYSESEGKRKSNKGKNYYAKKSNGIKEFGDKFNEKYSEDDYDNEDCYDSIYGKSYSESEYPLENCDYDSDFSTDFYIPYRVYDFYGHPFELRKKFSYEYEQNKRGSNHGRRNHGHLNYKHGY